MANFDDDERYLSLQEIADKLAISDRAVLQAVERQETLARGAIKIGRVWRIKLSSYNLWIVERERAAGARNEVQE